MSQWLALSSAGADTFAFAVPNVLTAAATKLAITYDPVATGPQQLISADTVAIDVPKLGLTGTFDPTDATPGLVVRTVAAIDRFDAPRACSVRIISTSSAVTPRWVATLRL